MQVLKADNFRPLSKRGKMLSWLFHFGVIFTVRLCLGIHPQENRGLNEKLPVIPIPVNECEYNMCLKTT